MVKTQKYLMSIRLASGPADTAPCNEVDSVRNMMAAVELHPE